MFLSPAKKKTKQRCDVIKTIRWGSKIIQLAQMFQNFPQPEHQLLLLSFICFWLLVKSCAWVIWFKWFEFTLLMSVFFYTCLFFHQEILHRSGLCCNICFGVFLGSASWIYLSFNYTKEYCKSSSLAGCRWVI